MRILVVLCMLLIPSLSFAQPKAKAKDKKDSEVKVTRLPNANDAYRLVAADLATIARHDAYYIRYLYINSFTAEKLKALTLGINYVSRATVPLRLTPLASGFVVRVDLRYFAPRADDLKLWLTLWEEFRFDPSFNLLITRGMFANILALPEEKQPTARVRRGQHFEDVAFKSLNLRDVDVVRFISPALDQKTVIAVQDFSGSAAPIVEASYFLTRLLTTIQDKGVFKTLYGGLYYEFAGIPESQDAKVTDEDLLFRQLGIGSSDETAVQFLDRLRSDQRLAVFRSQVTGKPRRVDIIGTPVRRPGDGISIASITHDLRDQDVDIDQHPIMNLVDFKDAAREMIFTRPNGTPGYTLYNSAGRLQRFVPQDIAADRTIPAPHTPVLQGAVSCISCHEADGSDGWKFLSNDVKTLVSDVNVFDDLKRGNKPLADTIDRIAGQYLGSPDKFIKRARDDYAETVLRITGPWKASAKSAQTDIVRQAAKEIIGIVWEYKYNSVDAYIALRELGFLVPKEHAVKFLKLLLPPDTRSLFHGVIPEDPRIAALKAGLALNRSEWDLAKAFAASRILHILERPQEK